MDLFSRVNHFVEERLGVRSYPIKVVILFSLIVLLSMFLAFTVDVLYSFREVRKEIETASVRAAKFRTTAIENAILGVLMADLSLVKLSREKGFDTLSPFLGTHIECAYDGEKTSERLI